MNIHHGNCCHPLDKKSPDLVNHGRPSKSNVGDIHFVLVDGGAEGELANRVNFYKF